MPIHSIPKHPTIAQAAASISAPMNSSKTSNCTNKNSNSGNNSLSCLNPTQSSPLPQTLRRQTNSSFNKVERGEHPLINKSMGKLMSKSVRLEDHFEIISRRKITVAISSQSLKISLPKSLQRAHPNRKPHNHQLLANTATQMERAQIWPNNQKCTILLKQKIQKLYHKQNLQLTDRRRIQTSTYPSQIASFKIR